MTQSTFIRLSGWGMVVAAVALLLTFASGPVTFFVAILLITVGLFGLYTRYGVQVGQVGRIALSVGVLGGLVGIVASLLLTMGDETWRPAMTNAMVIMFTGLVTFGLMTLRVKPMSYGNGLPMLAGLIWPLIALNAHVRYLATGQGPTVPFWLSFTLFAIMAFFLAWLGLVLQADAPHESTLAK